MIAEICYGAGVFARALKRSDDLPTKAAMMQELRAERARALSKIIGERRLKPVTMPSPARYIKTAAIERERSNREKELTLLTCKELDKLMRKLGIQGRSKARRKADKVKLIMGAGK